MPSRFQASFRIAAAALALASASLYAAETCTTQSQMKPAERDTLSAAVIALAADIQTGNDAALRAASIPELQADFASVTSLAAGTAPHLKGASPEPEELYLLDASTLPKSASLTAPDAQFFCTLNQSSAEADFSIPQLPPGRYAFAMVRFETPEPYRLSMLVRQEGGAWHLAGFYPKPLTAEGHDGLWFWQHARTLAAARENWTAWLYLQEAQSLLVPASFVSSTHLEKLAAELTATAPPALAQGVSPEAPLVIKSGEGAEFRFTALSVDTFASSKLDITAHIKADALGEAAVARRRNLDAAAALLATHPELRKTFHGVLISTDTPGGAPFTTELAMADIR